MWKKLLLVSNVGQQAHKVLPTLVLAVFWERCFYLLMWGQRVYAVCLRYIVVVFWEICKFSSVLQCCILVTRWINVVSVGTIMFWTFTVLFRWARISWRSTESIRGSRSTEEGILIFVSPYNQFYDTFRRLLTLVPCWTSTSLHLGRTLLQIRQSTLPLMFALWVFIQ